MSSIRPPSKSLFRPDTRIDQSVLHENQSLLASIERRNRRMRLAGEGCCALCQSCRHKKK